MAFFLDKPVQKLHKLLWLLDHTPREVLKQKFVLQFLNLAMNQYQNTLHYNSAEKLAKIETLHFHSDSFDIICLKCVILICNIQNQTMAKSLVQIFPLTKVLIDVLGCL